MIIFLYTYKSCFRYDVSKLKTVILLTRLTNFQARRIDIDLSASLKLSEDIGKMTKRMLDSVHDELRKNSLRKGGRHRSD